MFTYRETQTYRKICIFKKDEIPVAIAVLLTEIYKCGDAR